MQKYAGPLDVSNVAPLVGRGASAFAHLQRSSDFTVEGKGTFARASRAKSSGLAGCLLFGAAPRGDLAAV